MGLTSRARKKIRTTDSAAGNAAEHDVVQAFLAAAHDGQFDQLLQVLHPDVRLTVHAPDGKFVTIGSTDVATRAQIAAQTAHGQPVIVAARPGVISWNDNGTIRSLLAFTVTSGRITEMTAVIDPALLTLVSVERPA